MGYCVKHNHHYAQTCIRCAAGTEGPQAPLTGIDGAWDKPVERLLSEKLGEPADPMTVQVGGSHYKDMAIQPMEYSMANKLDALQHTIVKYVSRFRKKNGVEDLKKARHAIDMLIAHEEKNAIR